MQRQTRRLTAKMGTVAAAILLAFLSTVALSQGEEPTTPTPQSFTTVTLEKAVHFSAPDGTDVSIPAGRYDVAPGENEQLNLTAGRCGDDWEGVVHRGLAGYGADRVVCGRGDGAVA